MDLKEKKKMSVKIILSLIVVILIVVALFIAFSKKGDKEGIVNHKVVEELYSDHVDETCTEVIKITKNTEVANVNDKVLLYLIFGQMKNDKVLSSAISLDDYKASAQKVVDNEYIPLKFDYVFEGYRYSMNGNKITRKKASCDKNYVTKLYGYSGDNNLEVDVMAGYIEDGKVYNLNDEEIGTYSEDELNSILDKGTMQVYNYEKVNGDYKLFSVGVKWLNMIVFYQLIK